MQGIKAGEKKTRWKIVNPESPIQVEADNVNQHPSDLSGKTILLYWNGKPNGDIFLNRISELFLERVNNIKVVKAWEALPHTKSTAPTREASQATAREFADLSPDIVIGAPGDCAGCTTWLVVDQLNVEKLGIPTVTVVTSPFMELANMLPLAEGYREACIVQISHPVGMLPASRIREKAEYAFDQILNAATQWGPSSGSAAEGKAYPSQVFEYTGTVGEVNRYFVEKKWSLGLPIVPPSPACVDEMLGGTSREPQEVLGRVPPRMGTLTVELVAVHAAMAGCLPQYMPVLVAALEGLLSPQANLRLALSGTGTSQLIVIVNGPVVKEIGIGCEQGAAGKGHHANGSIGYAINLIAYTAGGSRPPSIDRSTLGSPSDYVCWVFGENEQALPVGWRPFHLERGFKKSDSVVTVMAAYPPVENIDHWSASAEEHVGWWRQITSPLQNMGGPSVPQVMEGNPMIALGPEHAQLVASASWSKDRFRKAFWEKTRVPLSVWPLACERERLVEMIGPVSGDSLVPITVRPEQFLVVIAGGDGKQSHYFPAYPGSFPVSKLVER